jgi:hypothetical protein
MANVGLSWVNRCDTATASAQNAQATLPASNLKDPVVARPWRATTNGAWFQMDFGLSVSIDTLAIFGALMNATDTVRHQLDVTTPGTGAVYDSTAVAGGITEGYNAHVTVLSSPVSARYWRCTLGASSRSGVTLTEVGRAWAGLIWRPAANMILGGEFDMVDASRVDQPELSRIRYVDRGAMQRVYRFGFDALTEAEAKDYVREMTRVAGMFGQVLMVPDSASTRRHNDSLLGYLTKPSPLVWQEVSRLAASFEIEESE